MGAAIMYPTTDIAERVRRIREDLGLRQYQFAKLVTRRTDRRCSKTTISRIESGKQPVQIRDVEAFAAVDPLNRGKAWLAFGGVPMSAPRHALPLGAVPCEVPGFPRASDATDLGYMNLYRTECRAIMRTWIDSKLADADFSAQTTARRYCRSQAEAEIGRRLNLNEQLLLATCVRDWMYQRHTLRAQQMEARR